jgi:flagellar biosynthesis/type III secretory pathway chaperone
VKEQWEKLITVLEEMLALYRAILALSQEKRTVLVAADGQRLEQITKQEELLILQAGKLDNQRSDIVKEIGNVLGLTPSEITLENISKHADDNTASRLKRINADFEKVLGELAPLNKVNTQLIQHALNFVNYNINILAQNQSGPTYASKGRQSDKPAPSRALFDHKV